MNGRSHTSKYFIRITNLIFVGRSEVVKRHLLVKNRCDGRGHRWHDPNPVGWTAGATKYKTHFIPVPSTLS